MSRYTINQKIAGSDKIHRCVGAKAASLFRMIRHGVKVPGFFAITTQAFEEYVKFNSFEDKIIELLKDKQYGAIRKLLVSGDIPPYVWNEIEGQMIELAADMVSVRSSAIEEDGEKKSFAGQFDTYLSVDCSKLKDYVKKCWASYYNDHVMVYVDETVDNLTGMGVIVQKMVTADVSGIGFSQSPVTGEKEILIEAAFGVGENIVSGVITPNQYYYFWNDDKVSAAAAQRILSEKDVRNIGKEIIRIRDFYGGEIDTEWCKKDEDIFFLQVRPVTAIEEKIPYKKTLERPLSLARTQILSMGEFEGINWLTDNNYYFNPLFLNVNGKTQVYYNDISQKENPLNMFQYLNENQNSFMEKAREMEVACKYLKDVIKGEKSFELSNFLDNIKKVSPFSSLGNIAGNLPRFLVGEIYNIFDDFRTINGELLAEAENFLIEKATDTNKSDLEYMTIEELFDLESIKYEDIGNRKKGYLYFNDIILAETELNMINNYLNEHKIALIEDHNPDDDSEEIYGKPAYQGKIKGRVTKIFSEQDFEKMQPGNILVTSMTVPKFLPVIKKAAAIVTDEGGVLCHAAIIAREMKIPTIVGTKSATRLLQDGMLIEVDANNGVVKLII